MSERQREKINRPKAMEAPSWVTPCTIGSSFHHLNLQYSPQRRAICFAHRGRTSRGARLVMADKSEMHHGMAAKPKPDLRNAKWDGSNIDAEALVSRVKFNEAGLVVAIAQQHDTGEVLMLAWMNMESIRETMKQGRAVYYSRSRKQLWRKGDTSGQVQFVRDVLLDCDSDALLLKVDQVGVACHTGRRSCFYTAFRPPRGEPEVIADVIMDPNEMYKSKKKNG